MRTLRSLLISIPVIVLPLTSLATRPAVAAQLGPADATEHLAKARAVDAKCRYLSEADHAELSEFTARAEIAVAAIEGVEAAGGAVKTGKLAGELMACTPESETLVRSSLDAGRQATRAAATRQPAPQPEPRALLRADPNDTQIIGGIGNLAGPGSRDLFDASQSRGSLARYRQEATAYYLELRCRTLSGRQVREFWNRIVDAHAAMVRAHGGRRVARAQAEAEDMAAERPCGGRSASFIEAAFLNLR